MLTTAQLNILSQHSEAGDRIAYYEALSSTRRQTKWRLAQIESQITASETEHKSRLRLCPRRARAHDILRSIPGIGEVTAVAILVECPEISTLDRKKTASLAGLTPMTHQSGQWRCKASIQGGLKFLRDALCMPTLVAARHNPYLARKYGDIITAGKPAKLALIAMMRKLIELASALTKVDRKWSPNHA